MFRSLSGWLARHRKVLILSALALGCLTFLAVWAGIRPKPREVEAWVYLHYERPGTETIDPVEFRIFRDWQRAEIISPYVLHAAMRGTGDNPPLEELQILKEQRNPIDWLSRHLHVSFPEDGNVMRLSLGLPDETVAAQIVNSVLDAYMTEVVDRETTRILRKKEVLNRRFVDLMTSVKTAMAELDRQSSSSQQLINQKRFESLVDSLVKIESEIRELDFATDLPPRVEIIERAVPTTQLVHTIR